MIAEPASLRNRHYLNASDTDETLDYAHMALMTDTTIEAASRVGRGVS